MSAHWQYLRYVLRHKWFVFVAGRKTRAPLWRLLVHDLSKFSPAEWSPYVRSFYGGYKYSERPPDVVAAFDAAWNHHQKHNDHHWQHWLLVNDAPARDRGWTVQSPDGGMTSNYITPRGLGLGSGLLIPTADITHPQEKEMYRLSAALLDDANLGARVVALLMPGACVREMVADWMGAGRAITGTWEAGEWYAKNKGNMVLHDDTRALVEALLREHASAAPAATLHAETAL